MRQSRAQRIVIYLAALAAATLILAPFAWLVISSVAETVDLLARPLHWIPQHASLGRYSEIFHGSTQDAAGQFRKAMVNSAIVASGSVAISLAVGVFGAYAFSRLRFRGRRTALLLFLSTYMLPPIALLIPLYLALVRLQLLDTKLGLVLVYSSFVTPFVLWIMSGYFRSIPPELEEAARVDGSSRLGALFRIVLPLSAPGLIATALFGFLAAWDEFLYALIFTSSLQAKTIPVAIAEFAGQHTVDFGLVAAGGVLAALPPVLIAFAFQRYIVGGLASGAIKG